MTLDIPNDKTPVCATPDAQALDCLSAPCGSNAENSPLISKLRHGGPRPNSGGMRVGAGRPRIIGLAPREIWIGPRWCVYQTHPQAEHLAAHELTRTGYRAYAPLIAVLQRDRVIQTMFHKVLVSRMPGYGFVELGPSDPWVPVQRSPGVRCLLLTTSNRPAVCAVGEVERHLADDAELCDLRREEMPALAVGTLVMIEAGAFAGRSAVVTECNSLAAKVEMDIFGRIVGVWVDRASVVTLATDGAGA